MPIEFVKDSWPGTVRTVTIGATPENGGSRVKSITVGGESALPFMHFEVEMPNRPQVALEIRDRRPDDWSSLLLETWADVVDDPADWAKAAEETGADLLQLTISLTDVDGNTTSPESAVASVKKVLDARNFGDAFTLRPIKRMDSTGDHDRLVEIALAVGSAAITA